METRSEQHNKLCSRAGVLSRTTHTHTPAMCWFSPCGPSLIEKIHKFFFTLQTGSVCVIPDKGSVSSTTMSIYQHMIRVVMAKLGNKEMSLLCLSVRYRDVAMVKFWPRFGGSHQASVILWSIKVSLSPVFQVSERSGSLGAWRRCRRRRSLSRSPLWTRRWSRAAVASLICR